MEVYLQSVEGGETRRVHLPGVNSEPETKGRRKTSFEDLGGRSPIESIALGGTLIFS